MNETEPVLPASVEVDQTQNDSRHSALRRYRRVRWRAGRKATMALVSLAVALVAGYGLSDPSFDDAQRHTVFLLAFAVMLWVTEAIPPFAVGLFIICFALFAFGTSLLNSQPEDAQKYVDTWSSPIIFLMLGGFFLAEGMRKTGVDRAVFGFALRLFGREPSNALLGLMLLTMVNSMVMSNTATTAMMIAAATPFLRTLGSESGFRRAVLVGIPAAAAVGGMGTIIGSSPNALAVGALAQAGVEVSFLDWMLLGAPVAVVLTVGFWFALRRRYPLGSTPVELDVDALEKPEIDSPASRRIVIVTIAVTMGLWLTSSFHDVSVATVSAVPVAVLTLTGVVTAKDVRALPWDTLMLVAGGMSLGIAIVDQGVAEFYLGRLDVSGWSVVALMLLFGFITVVVSNVMSNTATASILIPIAGVMLAEEAGLVKVMIGLCASAAVMLPVSTPPNAIAYSTGMVDARDFRFGGVLLGGATPLFVVAWGWVLARFLW